MKKPRAFAVVVCMLCLIGVFCFAANADTVAEGACGENVTWVLDDSGTITISGSGEMTDFENYTTAPWADYRKEIKKAVIEDGVTSVGSHSFNMIRSLTSVSLPDSVTAIGKYAFGNCWGLTEIALPEKLVIIGDSAFASSGVVSLDFPATLESVGNLEALAITSYNVAAENPYFSSEDGILYNKEKSTLIAYPTAMKNTSFTIPDSVTVVGRDAFYCNKYLKHIEIGNSVKTIERSAFFNSKIETVDFGESVERIEYSAFGYCNNLSEAYLPDTVTYIGNQAFYPCYSLKEIILPNSELYIGKAAFCSDELTSVFIPEKVKTIEANPFEDCSKLTEIIVDKNNAYYSSVGGVLYDKNQTLLIVYPASKSDTRFSIPGTVESIGSYSFEGVCYLKEITVPDKVTTLVAHTFSGATSLEKIYLPDTIKSIGTGAFSDCSSLKGIKLPSALTSVNSQLFYSCTSLRTLIIPEKVSYVDYCFIQGCTGLEEINFLCSDCRIIPTAYANMGNPVIKGYENSTAKTFAEEYGYKFSVITADGTFGDGFIWILDENGVLIVTGNGAMPDFASYVDTPWAEHRTVIKRLVIENGVTTIGRNAFYLCEALEEVSLPDSLTSIGKYAFESCYSLEEVVLPENLVNIDSAVFKFCKTLKEIYLPASLQTIESNVFDGTVSLEKIEVSAESESFASVDGILYDKTMSRLVHYPSGKTETSFTLPSTVKYITDHAFYENKFLENVDFCEGLEYIGEYAFYCCEKISEINIPDTVVEIGTHAFYDCLALETIDFSDSVTVLNSFLLSGCENLISVEFPSGLKEIEGYAFDDCFALFFIDLPSSLEEIHSFAFADCDSLEVVYIPANVRKLEGNSFNGCSSLYEIYVDEENENYITNEDGVVFDAAMTTLICYPAGKKNETYKVPSSVTTIGNFAFSDCNNLRYIDFGDCNLDTIEHSAMADCEALEAIVFPETVQTIGNNATVNCDSLASVVILNRNCEIYDNSLTIFSGVVIVGFEGSTAQAYAEKYNRTFLKINSDFSQWSYADGVLTIDTAADIPEIADNEVFGWYIYSRVTDAIVLNDIAVVPAGAFRDFINATAVIINADPEATALQNPSTEIRENAFSNCKSIGTVVAFGDVNIDADIFTAGEKQGILFLSEGKKNSGNMEAVEFVYANKIVSFNSGFEVEFYDFFNLLAALCKMYPVINELQFVEFSLINNDIFLIEEGASAENAIVLESVQNQQLVIQIVDDTGNYKTVSFNEFFNMIDSVYPDSVLDFRLAVFMDDKLQDSQDGTTDEISLFEQISVWFSKLIVSIIDKLRTLLGILKK